MQVPPVIIVPYGYINALSTYKKMSIYYFFNFYRIIYDLRLVKDIKNSFALKVLFTNNFCSSNNNIVKFLGQKMVLFSPLAIREVLFEPVDNATLLSHFPEILLIVVSLLA